MRAIKATAERYAINFPIEVRFVAPDDALLSPAHERETVYVAVHVFKGMEWEPYFRAVEAIADEHGGRPHWGKRHFQTAATLAPRYPGWERFAAVRARLDPDGVFANAYTDRVLGARCVARRSDRARSACAARREQHHRGKGVSRRRGPRAVVLARTASGLPLGIRRQSEAVRATRRVRADAADASDRRRLLVPLDAAVNAARRRKRARRRTATEPPPPPARRAPPPRAPRRPPRRRARPPRA